MSDSLPEIFLGKKNCVEKNVLCALLVRMLIILLLFLGREKTEKP